MKKKKFGFTLIELMVAITIGILIVGLGSVALNNFNEKQKVEATKQELLANLRFARNYAATNQFPDGGNRVFVEINNQGLLTMKSYNVGDVFIETFYSKDITPNNVYVSFDNEVKFTVSEGRSLNGPVNIGVSGNNSVKNIKIDASGLIYEE